MEKIKVSVIVAVYNVEAYLKKCIDSIISQKYKEIEIILVNDGSSDDSESICEGYQKIDKRIKVINQSNKGLVAARQEGAKIATGEYVLFIDGDDWIEEDMIHKMIEPIIKNETIDMVVCNFSYDYKQYSVQNNWKISKGLYKKQKIEEEIVPNLIYPRIIPSSVWCKLIRKKIVDDNIYRINRNIEIGEDTIMTTLSVLDCRNMYLLDSKPLYHYRQNENSMTKKYKKEYFSKTLTLVDNLKTEVSKKKREDINKQINQLLVTFGFLAIENEYISKYNSVSERKRISLEIAHNKQFLNAFKDMDVSTLSIKNKIYFYLIKNHMAIIVCWINLIMRGLKIEK